MSEEGDRIEGEKKKTGFAKLTPEERKAISSRGGKASQQKSPRGFTSETARAAAKKSAGKGYRFTTETGKQASQKSIEKRKGEQ